MPASVINPAEERKVQGEDDTRGLHALDSVCVIVCAKLRRGEGVWGGGGGYAALQEMEVT